MMKNEFETILARIAARRLYLAILCALATVASVPAAIAATPTLVSSFRTAFLSGVGRVIRAEQIGTGDRAVFVNDVRYGTKLARHVRLCSGRSLRVGDPVLFAIGNPPKHASCPAGTWYVPVESTTTYALDGFVDAYSDRLVFRIDYPQSVNPDCDMPLTTVLTTLSRNGKDIKEEFGPLDAVGSYFFWNDFLRCLKSK